MLSRLARRIAERTKTKFEFLEIVTELSLARVLGGAFGSKDIPPPLYDAKGTSMTERVHQAIQDGVPGARFYEKALKHGRGSRD